MKTFFTAAAILAAHQAMVAARANVSCVAGDVNQPALFYTISPKFIWFPVATTADEVTGILQQSLALASRSAYSTGRAARSTVRNFLNTPCTLHLQVSGVHMQPDASTAFRLLNYTLGDTDLICRLATHKLGRTYTEIPHTMLSSHIRASIRQKSTRALPQRNRRRERADVVDETSVVEYRVDCPAAAGPIVSGEQAVDVIEGLKGLAQVRDCDWCRKAAGELQSICKPESQGLENLSAFVSQKQWSLGGATCETCS